MVLHVLCFVIVKLISVITELLIFCFSGPHENIKSLKEILKPRFNK
jgi:hypothetical protein